MSQASTCIEGLVKSSRRRSTESTAWRERLNYAPHKNRSYTLFFDVDVDRHFVFLFGACPVGVDTWPADLSLLMAFLDRAYASIVVFALCVPIFALVWLWLDQALRSRLLHYTHSLPNPCWGALGVIFSISHFSKVEILLSLATWIRWG